MRPDALIVSRARDADHARHLYQLGVADAVPETVEASLQLSEAALVGLGVPTGPVIASIHEKRDEIRHALQEAAQKAGLDVTRAVRAKAAQTAAQPRRSLTRSQYICSGSAPPGPMRRPQVSSAPISTSSRCAGPPGILIE